MNTGVIAVRYARALLKYTAGTGRGEQVYGQVTELLADPSRLPEPLEPDLERFTALVMSHHRDELLREMLTSFVDLYRREHGIKLARLVTALPSPELEKRLEEIVSSKTGCRVLMESKVDPSIIGGFVFTVDDMMLDASVSRQIELIRRQFIQSNKRIV